MKIAYIDSVFPTYTTFLTWEMKYVKSLGYDIIVFPLRPKPQNEILHDDGKDILNNVRYVNLISWDVLFAITYWIAMRPMQLSTLFINIVRAYKHEKKYLYKTIYGLLKALPIARFCNEKKVDLIHSNWAHVPATIAYFISQLTDIPFSFSAHAGADLYRSQILLKEKIARARFVLTCTKKNKDFLFKYILNDKEKEKIHVVYHGIDISLFKQNCTNRIARDKQTRLISVGALDDIKGCIYMIRACRMLLDHQYNVHYTIVGGDGNMSSEIQKEILSLDLSDKVNLTGILDRENLVSLLNKSDIFIMPSIESKDGGQDGIPNVMIEAMAIKLPVVATDAGAITEILIHGETGVLVEQKSPQSLCQQIEKTIDNEYPLNSITEKAYSKIINEFDREECVKKVGKIIKQHFAV